jgi:hypothetical protein
MPNKKGNDELGLCKMFKDTCYVKSNEVTLYNFAIHCRSNENLCGKSGFLYEDASENVKVNAIDMEELNELNNRCCGEVNEKEDIEQLERDFFEVLQKIKKHNTKNIYRTSKDLYKLFRRP